jgi:hypothetical protein
MTALLFDQCFAFGPRRIRKPETQRMARPIVRTTEIRRLLEHWYYLKGDRPLPRRSDLDPADIAYCLGNVALVEIEQPFRPRYRLVGTNLVRLLGEDPTGRYIDEMYSTGIRREALAAYRRTVETGAPDYTERMFSLLFLKFGYYRLLLPFTWRREGQADLVLAAFFQTDRSIRRAVDWLVRVPEQDR